jgi:hypothetical protein
VQTDSKKEKEASLDINSYRPIDLGSVYQLIDLIKTRRKWINFWKSMDIETREWVIDHYDVLMYGIK